MLLEGSKECFVVIRPRNISNFWTPWLSNADTLRTVNIQPWKQ